MRVVEEWRRMLIRFFIPLDHSSHDAEAYDNFRLKVVVLALPDASHTVRIACRDPLNRIEPLTNVFDTLFHREDALVKDIRFSDLWAAKLEVAQQRILEDRGSLGAYVREVFRTFSFAPQRFESFYKPLLDFAADVSVEPHVCESGSRLQGIR